MQMVRIRNNAKITRLDMSPEQRKQAEDIAKTSLTKYIKRNHMREKTGHSFCCVCGVVPSVKVTYPITKGERIEYYCDFCITSVYERTKDRTNEEIAESYGCIRQR